MRDDLQETQAQDEYQGNLRRHIHLQRPYQGNRDNGEYNIGDDIRHYLYQRMLHHFKKSTYQS